MPPKKTEASRKTVEKQKQKIVEDKTFGLKNKKGSKQQKYVQNVTKQVMHGNKSAKELEKAQQDRISKKDEKKRELDELNALFKPVADLQKLGKGVDPKSVLCVFFKQGQCTKGDKCKFSHDLTIERKAEKRSLYAGDKKESGMDSWDQERLEDVVARKHGTLNSGLPPTTIICKYFLDAVESNKYGWFWECPNGGACHYRHALPSGFILSKDKKKMEEQKETISLDDLIEHERQALGLNQTKVTFQTFLAWKKRKRLEKQAANQAEKDKRQADFKQGRTIGISGREMFEFNPDFVEEEVDMEGFVIDSNIRELEDGEESVPVREINLDMFEITEADEGETRGKANAETTAVGSATAVTRAKSGVEIDEALFNDANLDDLNDELEEFEIEN